MTPRTKRATVLACLLTLALVAPALAGAPLVKASGKPKVDLVFAIDTTGSMGGLIQAAKTKVWSIVNGIASGKPTPDIRVGLVAFRDRGDDYVTQVTDLTADLDAMYSTLMGFAAGGGGDGPESVNQALADAVTKMSWSQGPRVLKIVFLVGDAPPHMDYPDDPKYPQTCQQAVKQGIIIHAIRCGNESETAEVWQKIANLSEGRFFSIAQSGGVAEVATPYDEEIASADRALRGTSVFYGSAEKREYAHKKMADMESTMAAAPAEAKAERAAYAASSGAPAAAPAAIASDDLVAAVEAKRIDLDKLKDEQLPEELRKMSKAERRAFVDKKLAERAALQQKLVELNKNRAQFIDELMKKGPADGFDAKVMEAVREKAGKAGITY